MPYKIVCEREGENQRKVERCMNESGNLSMSVVVS